MYVCLCVCTFIFVHLYASLNCLFPFLLWILSKVFLEEEVDVAILEVGIGGRFDATNVADMVTVCGISSLGYEHTNILGHTLTEIAYHKGGIIKVRFNEIIVSGKLT